MGKYIFIVLLVGVCFSQKSYNIKHLVKQNGVWYKKFSEEVVNGTVFEKIDGIDAPLGKMVDGKKEGKWIDWNDDGTKSQERYFQNDILNGEAVVWYDSGEKRYKAYYKNGLLDGKQIAYHKNGKVSVEGLLKNGKKFGLWTSYNENEKLFLKQEFENDTNYEITSFYDDETISTHGHMKDNLPFDGSFLSMFERNPVDNAFGRKHPFHAFYHSGELKKLVEIDSNKDTLSIEKIIEGARVKTHIWDENLQKLVEYFDSKYYAKKLLVYDEGQIKVHCKQYNEGSKNIIDFELENLYYADYSSIWFNIDAIEKESKEPYSHRFNFRNVKKKSTSKTTLRTYGEKEIENIKLELTRTIRE